MSKYKKVIVIGLDGADWRLLRPWLQAGYLPVLQKLYTQGTSGKLRSTIRPESSVAWSSFATGVNPGKHGIFGFVQHVPRSYQYRIANGANIHTLRFWDILGEAGCSSCLINVPFTYPPKPIHGVLIGGMMTPGVHVPFVHPPELQKELLNRFPNYLFDAGDAAKERNALIAHVTAYTEQQTKLALWLLQEQNWGFAGLVFTGPDRLQHFLWSDPQALLAHYQALDSAVGQILARLTEPTLTLVISDHGFNGCGGRFYVNKWLEENAYLTLNKGRNWHSALYPIFSRLKTIGWVRKLKQTMLPYQGGVSSLKTSAFAKALNWDHTKAYYGLDGGIRLNVTGREPQGIVDPNDYEDLRQNLQNELRKLTIPGTEKSLFANVFMREELYTGDFSKDAPDLILEPQRDAVDAASHFILDSSINADQIYGSSLPYEANHAPDGILIASGTGVMQGGSIAGTQIIDIAPTILAALDVPIPTYMDGNYLAGLFSPDDSPTPRYARVDAMDPADVSGPLDAEWEQVIVDRLGNLGYLD